jgi:antitoxin component of MazEF toxin-antitoxin module
MDYTRTTKIVRWGNSLAVRIPKAMAKTIAAVDGSPAVITVKNGTLVVRTARASPARTGMTRSSHER